MPLDKNKTINRINFLMFFSFAVCAIFIFRLFSIQVLAHEDYKTQAKEQYWDLQEIPSKRGDILSSYRRNLL